MKTYLAFTALVCSLASAVDLYDDDLLDDDELYDDATSARIISNSLSYNGFKYTFHDKKKNWKIAKHNCVNEGGNILTIRSDDELAAILPLIPFRADGRREAIHMGLRWKKNDW